MPNTELLAKRLLSEEQIARVIYDEAPRDPQDSVTAWDDLNPLVRNVYRQYARTALRLLPPAAPASGAEWSESQIERAAQAMWSIVEMADPQLWATEDDEVRAIWREQARAAARAVALSPLTE